jgi:hypothetical protein
MGPVSRAATIQFQREVTGALRDIVQELQATRALINNRLGGNALDHETLHERIDATERRLVIAEKEIRALEATRPAG